MKRKELYLVGGLVLLYILFSFLPNAHSADCLLFTHRSKAQMVALLQEVNHRIRQKLS